MASPPKGGCPNFLQAGRSDLLQAGRSNFFPTQSLLRATFAKVQLFANATGDNFLSWRAQFQVITQMNGWTDAEAKMIAFSLMKGIALKSIMYIDTVDPKQTLKGLLHLFRKRFLPRTCSQML